MAARTVFFDNDNNEMDVYINDKGALYIGVGQKDEDIAYNGWITLDKNDVTKLIDVLTELHSDMED